MLPVILSWNLLPDVVSVVARSNKSANLFSHHGCHATKYTLAYLAGANYI